MDLKIYVMLLFLAGLATSRDIEIENFNPDGSIKSDDFIDYGTLRLKKEGKNRYVIAGDFQLLESCGDEKEIMLEVKDKGKNQVIISMQEKFCDFIKTDEMIWPDIKSKLTFPEGDGCPMMKGNYALNGFEIDENKFSNAPPGDYTARLAILENGKVLAAVDVNCKVNP